MHFYGKNANIMGTHVSSALHLCMSDTSNSLPCVQSILKEINPEYSLERPMLELQYFGHQVGRAGSLKAEGEGGGRG